MILTNLFKKLVDFYRHPKEERFLETPPAQQQMHQNFVAVDMPKPDFPTRTESTLTRGVLYSLFAGLFAALAAVFGKLSMDMEWIHSWLPLVINMTNPTFTQASLLVWCFV
eukprot:TRINITY_DN2470_c0_g2_i3.p2 TRINITY_DN2470_c0_g2~~TRINITY_DN2470_c0_g2_i3.p2  ORF type:complete len:111 (+),score=10.79 TRINITY_DN2470_c0_g2_i3:497-829(+)